MQGKQELKIKGGTKTEEFKIHWIPQCVKKKKPKKLHNCQNGEN